MEHVTLELVGQYVQIQVQDVNIDNHPPIWHNYKKGDFVLTDQGIDFEFKGVRGIPLGFIIDGEALYDMAIDVEKAFYFLDTTDVIDISNNYPEHNGITVRLIKNGRTLEEFQTTEYFGSILLSNPLVINLLNHAFGHHVYGNNARFENNEFILKYPESFRSIFDFEDGVKGDCAPNNCGCGNYI